MLRSSSAEVLVPLWGSLGEEGREESAISSMSEWDEADLGDFFLLKACLKELRSCNDNKQNKDYEAESYWKMIGQQKKQYSENRGGKQQEKERREKQPKINR